MDALRPSVAVISCQQKQIDSRVVSSTFVAASASTAQKFSLVSPNSFAPPIGSSSATAPTSRSAATRAQQSTVSTMHTTATQSGSGDARQSSAAALPAFLSRRSSAPEGSAQRMTQAAGAAGKVESNSNGNCTTAQEHHDTEEPLVPLRECDEDDERDSDAALDDNRFYDNLDDEEDAEETEESLMKAAEEISAAAGMTHAEALALLLEHHQEKMQRRKERQLEAPRRVKVRRAPEQEAEGVFALTGTPLPENDFCDPPKVTPVNVVSRSTERTTTTTDPSDGLRPIPRASAGVEEETTGARSQRLLAELFPDGCGGACGVRDDDVEDFRVARARRLTEKHQRIVEHLETKRGVVPTPKSLVQQTPLVKAFELEMMKRSALKHLKEEMLRRQAREAAEERRLKGAKSNLAIQQRIQASKKGPGGVLPKDEAAATAAS